MKCHIASEVTFISCKELQNHAEARFTCKTKDTASPSLAIVRQLANFVTCSCGGFAGTCQSPVVIRSTKSSDKMPSIRQNYHIESEAGVNKQINLELYASYVYLSMASYFQSATVALPGAHEYFMKASDEEREHAKKFLKFQNQRGGTVVLQDIVKPGKNTWGTLRDAVNDALELEKNVNQALLDLHGIAEKHSDPQMQNWIEQNFLTHQVEAIKELGDHLRRLERVGPGLGEYMYDHESLVDD
ncbi:soma ferritin-like [Acanthaster planci]|uniref:Ferritin n=1 Tax=Acanthaster planci TaxID=133434 RepID=A0A8B7Y9C5_ACAPL|nr:soma ferritin-like [Acanthaster planci]